MAHQLNGLFPRSLLKAFSFLIFIILLKDACHGQPQLIGPSQALVARAGDDVILPCHVEPAYDVSTKTLEWARSSLDPRFVYVSRANREIEILKNPSFKGRTSVFVDELKNGNISLKISKVKSDDTGIYRCYISDVEKEALVELVVASVAATSPVISLSGIDRNRGGVVLQCESAGWYPEPELLWLDGEGNLLSAGPTETLRGPDDLYTVSSRVTVEKRHSNNITCRVQQRNTNQSRETHIHVPGDLFNPSCSSAAHITIGVVVTVLLILAVVLVVWKYRSKCRGRNFTRMFSDHSKRQLDTKEKGETKHLTEDSVDTGDINTKQENLEAQKEKQAVDKSYLLMAVQLLMNHKFNLEEDIDDLTSEVWELEKEQDKNQSQLVTNMQPTEQNSIQSAKINQDEETKTDLKSMKKALDKKIHEKESVLYAVDVMTEKKKELDDTLETIIEQLEKIKNRNEVQMQLQSGSSEA